MNEKSWNVCVIEPNKFEGQIIVDLLRNAGVDKVRLFAVPADGLEWLEACNANIIIASFEMQPVDGAAWTRAFRRNRKLVNRKAAIFITSGAFSRAMAEQCRHAGANALIGKPVSSKVLLATIKKVLGAPREFIDNDGDGYVGPCRRAGIVTAGAPKKRRKVDEEGTTETPVLTLAMAVEQLANAGAAYAMDLRNGDACESALRQVQAYAVNAGDGPLMRACAAFALQLSSARQIRPEAARAALEVCVNSVTRLAALPPEQSAERDTIAEGVRQAVAKAAMQRAA